MDITDSVILMKAKGEIKGRGGINFAAARRRAQKALAQTCGPRAGGGRRNLLVTLARSIENGNANGAAEGASIPAGEHAAASAAKSAAKKTAKKAAGGGLAQWWNNFDSQARKVTASVTNGVAKKVGEMSSPMEMKVNVDVLKPSIDGFKQGLTEFWVKVPPPVRKVSPYVGVALVTALALHTVESKLRQASEKKLAMKIMLMEEEKNALTERMKELESTRYMRGDSTVDLSRAVAEATQAAAQAAAAAAEASQYCIVNRR
jgi:hypothetical protein